MTSMWRILSILWNCLLDIIELKLILIIFNVWGTSRLSLACMLTKSTQINFACEIFEDQYSSFADFLLSAEMFLCTFLRKALKWKKKIWREVFKQCVYSLSPLSIKWSAMFDYKSVQCITLFKQHHQKWHSKWVFWNSKRIKSLNYF